MKEYRSHAHSVSSCKYHLVWCLRYRHPVLNVVEDDMRELFGETGDSSVMSFWRWRSWTATYTDPCKQIRSTVRRILLGNSSRTRGSTCWSDIPRFGSRISGEVVSGTLGTTWEQRVRCRRKWLNGISRGQNIRSSVGLHPRPWWVGELALTGCLDLLSVQSLRLLLSCYMAPKIRT